MAEVPSDDTPRQDAAGGHSPSLRDLDNLPGVTTSWYRLGLQLGVKVDELNVIEKNYPRDANMCKIKMFTEWQRGDTNPTYHNLVRALAAVGKKKLAESVCSDQGISLSVLDATVTDTIKMHQSQEEKESDAVTAARTTIGHLQKEYKQLVVMTQKAVKAESPTLDEFRTDITLQLPEPVRLELSEPSLMKKLQPMYDAKNIDEIFGILNLSVWGYLNFGLLRHVVDIYGDDELQQRMLKYTTSVESFRNKTTLAVFWKAAPVTRRCPEIATKLRERLKRITFKHGNLDDSTTLKDIESYHQDLAQEYSFPDFTIILADIGKGCVATVWLVPPSLAAKLAHEKRRGNVSFFKRHNILEFNVQESATFDHFELPDFLKVQLTRNLSNGIFTSKAIQPGVEIFTSKPYAIAIGGATLKDVKSVCSHCLKPTSPSPVECEKCNAVGYCSKECLKSATKLHKIECQGLLKLEELRGRKDLYIPPLVQAYHVRTHWPPPSTVVTARALNRKVLEGKKDWEINYLTYAGDATTIEDAASVIPYAIPLVHESVAIDDIVSDAYYRVALNTVGVRVIESSQVSVTALHPTHSLLHHSCQPNCSYGSDNQTMSIYALVNIHEQEQLCISYISREETLLYGSARREKLRNNCRFECTCSTCLNEQEPGSEKWVLNQKKKSFIAPWTQETANHIMEEGLKHLKEVELSTSIKEWFKIVEVCTPALSNQRRYLSEANIIRILTSLSLMNAHDQLGNNDEALKLAEAVLPFIKLYDSAEGIGIHMARMSCYHFRMGNTQNGLHLFWESFDTFPRNMNNEPYLTEALCKAISVEGPSIIQKVLSIMEGLTIYVDKHLFQLVHSLI